MDSREVSPKLMENVHPYLPEAYQQLKQGRISRREFIRLATLLGLSAGLATVAAQCGADLQAPLEASLNERETAATPETSIKRGGVLRVASSVAGVDHPARYLQPSEANLFRHILEYLTETDVKNITHPYLLESWQANENLTAWTLKLRRGIRWSNGDELTTEDIHFNFSEWLNPDTGSSILSLWNGFLTMNGVEVVDDYTIVLHLDKPLLTVPENLFHYPAQIVHRNFNGDVTVKENPGTGPMQLDEFHVGERMRVVRRDGYWQMGADGQPLPYLDAIEWIDLGDDHTPQVIALQGGQIDTLGSVRLESLLALRDDERLTIGRVGTSTTLVLRVQVDQEPWSDVRVRNALKKIQNRERILASVFFGEGLLGHDVHVSPVHPEFAPMEVPAYDPEGAKSLLAEAGFPEGLDVSIALPNLPEIVALGETLQEDAGATGINITLSPMPASAYFEIWTQTPVGITSWGHRPLAVMLLPLAYTGDSEGKPVPWNETHWVDEEFSELLAQAQGTLDIEARRMIMADLQQIMQARGPVGIAAWRNLWTITNRAFQNVQTHPSEYNLWREVWYDADKDPFVSQK